MTKKRNVPYPEPDIPMTGGFCAADPFGSYTGIPVDSEEKPIQDADDL